ncbi:MAG: FecR family protein [Luteimonas sp.]
MSTDRHDRQRLREEAMAWRMRLTEDPGQAPALDAWRRQSPAHGAAWREVQDLWGFVGAHATSAEAIAARRGALDRAHRHNRRRWRGRSLSLRAVAAVAACALLVVGLAGGLLWQMERPDVYRTALGERRMVTLEDGSVISLDVASEVRVKYSRSARELDLVRGQARFDVFPDPQRPFAVQAGPQRVLATGTAFNIDLLGQQVSVTIIEGHVLVSESSASAVEKAPPMALQEGQRLTTAALAPTRVESVNVDRAIAWQQGRLVFEDEPLSAVAARVSRYSRQQVVVADDGAAELRLSGVLDAGDVPSFLTTVTGYLPVQAYPMDDERIELRMHPGERG